ncbi:MAG: hypothetical protein JKP90_20675 [Desulfofustis sp. PB-SRB1]|nr:hypothetical protein [Desulfofustis sp. PB-SRB1]
MNAALELGVPLSLISESVFALPLRAFKDLRVAAAGELSGPAYTFTGERQETLEDLGKALYAAKIISYAQGFGLIQEASRGI